VSLPDPVHTWVLVFHSYDLGEWWAYPEQLVELPLIVDKEMEKALRGLKDDPSDGLIFDDGGLCNP